MRPRGGPSAGSFDEVVRVVLARGAMRGPVSGAEETLVTYARHLRQAGHDASVLLLYPPASTDPYLRRLHDEGIPILSVARSDTERWLLAARARGVPAMDGLPAVAPLVRRIGRRMMTGLSNRHSACCRDHLARSGADLIHVLGRDAGAPVIIGAGHAAGIPVLYQELNEGASRSKFTGFVSSLGLCSEGAALSPRLAQELGDALPSGLPLSVLPIIVDPPEDDAPPTRSASDVTFGFSGRLVPSKGLRGLVEAFAAAQKQVPNTRLCVAGAGPEERPLTLLAKARGVSSRCELTGVYVGRRSRTDFMRGIDVLVLASVSEEGTPNSIIEAMAHGLPIISTSVGGIADIVTPDIGVLVPPGDPGALAKAMIGLAGDTALRTRMGAAAVEKYERTFSPAAVMPHMLRTYRRVAHGEAPPAGADARPTAHVWAEPWSTS